MSTRAERTSPEHVRALNTIELAFYGPRTRLRRHTSGEKLVLTRWHEYHFHLHNGPKPGDFATPDDFQGATASWTGKSEELFLNLLEALGAATNHALSRDQIRTGHYFPRAQADSNTENAAVRRGLIEVLAGKRTLGMDVRSVQLSVAQQGAQKTFQDALLRAVAEPRPTTSARIEEGDG
jgi:hypothetical protein